MINLFKAIGLTFKIVWMIVWLVPMWATVLLAAATYGIGTLSFDNAIKALEAMQ